MSARVLHILPRLTGGGPARSLIALVKAQAALGLPYRHSLLTLKRDAYPPTLLEAKHAGMEITREPDIPTFQRHVETADIVTLHFWNTPEMYAALQIQFPPSRVVLWSKILGNSPPQVLTQALTAYVDWCMATDSSSLALPALEPAVRAGRAGVIPAVPDFERLANVRPRSHDTFNVGYIGTVNANKLHPNFIEMSAAVEVPNLKVIVCGGHEPGLEPQAAASARARNSNFSAMWKTSRPSWKRSMCLVIPSRPTTIRPPTFRSRKPCTSASRRLFFRTAAWRIWCSTTRPA